MHSITAVTPTGAIRDRLIERACREAAADEVTPPLTPGTTWTRERITWLRDYLDRCAGGLSGLDGPAGESVWAVVVDGDPVGAVRLQRTPDPDRLETGIWLARGVRGRGLAVHALGAAIEQARRTRVTWLDADTTPSNEAALAALRQLGFVLSEPSEAGRIRATLLLSSDGEGRIDWTGLSP